VTASASLLMLPAARLRRRGLEVEFLAERYHRAFAEEAASLRGIVVRVRKAPLSAAFHQLTGALALHERLQEESLFSSYEAGLDPTPEMAAAWLADGEALARACDAMCAVCDGALVLTAAGQRIEHFASEIKRHLRDEEQLLASWRGHVC
jgi:hypothetical protein